LNFNNLAGSIAALFYSYQNINLNDAALANIF